MTDVLERLLDDDALAPEPTPLEEGAVRPPISDTVRILVGSLSAAAGVIHLVMVPSHIDEWAAEGIAFAVAGWFQLGFAALVLRRPSRRLLALGILANLAFIGAWIVTRTAGSPWGPHAGHAEEMSIVDLSTVAFEAVLVLALGAVLLWPGRRVLTALGGQWPKFVVPIAVLGLTTFAITSADARNHASGAHGDHGGGAGGGHAHGGGEEGGDGHSHAAGGDDLGFSELSNGHHHEIVERELSPMTDARLEEQLAITRQVAARYPTVADAEAAGYRRAGGYSPGLGAHYVSYGGAGFLNIDGVMNRDDLEHPLSIIYDGTDPDSEVAGFMYYSFASLDNEPAGFIGPNDVWHYHESICIKYSANGEIDAPFGMDNEATPEQCASVGGSLLPITNWMVHVWSVPGWENEHGGVFGEHNAKLTCPDGTYYQLPPEEWADSPLTTCRS